MKYLLILLMPFSMSVMAQTTYYSNSNGMPLGTAQQVGNTTYYSSSNGIPIGTAQQVGNTTYYSNANGMPAGTAQGAQPIQAAPSQFMGAPVAPTFPTSPLFPSSPRGM